MPAHRLPIVEREQQPCLTLDRLSRVGAVDDRDRACGKRGEVSCQGVECHLCLRRAVEARKSDPGSFSGRPQIDDLLDLIAGDPDSPDQPSETAAHSDPGSLPDRQDQAPGVQMAERSASTPVLIRGPGEGSPPGPIPDTATLICSRCRYPADRLIPGTGGIQLCKTCTYPAGGAPEDTDTEEGE
jgi:hypothetical protein